MISKNIKMPTYSPLYTYDCNVDARYNIHIGNKVSTKEREVDYKHYLASDHYWNAKYFFKVCGFFRLQSLGSLHAWSVLLGVAAKMTFRRNKRITMTGTCLLTAHLYLVLTGILPTASGYLRVQPFEK